MNNNDYQDLPAISSHWLIAMLDSPATCWRKYLDPQRPAEEPTDAIRFGTLVHALALTPKRWNQEIVVSTADRRTRAGRAHWDWLKAQGWMAVTPAEFDRARALVAALQADPAARKLLTGGRKERTIIQPRASGLLPLKGRLDIHHEAKRQVVELKTTWNLAAVETAMERYRYPLSAAFYAEISRSLAVHFVFVQTREPLQVAVMTLTPAQLQAGREQWQTALARFDACWAANEWPEAEPGAPDDDPLMVPFSPILAPRRFEIPVGELAL